MMWFRLTAAAVILACSTGAAAAEEEEREDKIECWKGSYLTGFHGHAGAVIDRMSIVCARWNPEHGKLDKPIYATPGLIGQSDGGAEIDAQCARGSAVAGGYAYDYAHWEKREVLHHFDFHCRPVGGEGDLQRQGFGSTSNAEIVFRPANRRQCADGMLATGIWARYRKFILDWQLICTPGPSAILVTKPPGPDAFRDTMTSKRKGGGLIGSGLPPTSEPPPPPSPPIVEMAETTNATDVYRKLINGSFVRVDDDPDHFLPIGFVAPVLLKEGGWWKLELKNVPFVPGGEGWVAADQLKMK